MHPDRIGNKHVSVLQIDVMFSDVDEVDVSSPQLPFVFGRRREPAQPQIPRFRAVAKKAKTFVALLSSEEQVGHGTEHTLVPALL